MQIADALKIRNEEGGIKQGGQNKLCSTHNLVPPMKDITPETAVKCAEKLEPIEKKEDATEEKKEKKSKDDFDEGK